MTRDLAALGRELAAMAQNGLYYGGANPWERQRYERLRAIAAELLAHGEPARASELDAGFAREDGHATPKVDVRGFCQRPDGRVLLVREVVDGRWCLPGGWAEPELTPSEAVAKEIREEAGLAVTVDRLLGCFDRRLATGVAPHAFAIYKLVFACTVHGQVPRGDGPQAEETSAADWFPLDDLPPLSAGRTHHDQLARLAVAAGRDEPAVFD